MSPYFSMAPYFRNSVTKDLVMRSRVQFTASLGVLLLFLVFIPSSDGSLGRPPADTQSKSQVVYVCACLKTKSCSCMTEAKMEGPCACGTEGGPPLKPVPKDSAWAKENRDALAK
jgi:hypothetical protein